MKLRSLPLLLALAAAGAGAADAPPPGMAAIETLGRLNGQALACSEAAAAARAKELMLRHAPRTSGYGTVYEQATQRGFADQVRAAACPAGSELVQRIDVVAAELGRQLPPAP
ncbi:MAG TPA: hypothetical protein VF801_15905 [Rhodocyclaceae bacterium]